MRIEAFTFDRSLVRTFVDFGYDLYRDDRSWIAPFRSDINSQLSPDYLFYKRAGNRHCHFLAFQNARPVGRVSAMINTDLKDSDGCPVGTLGFFECIDDSTVARGLFEAAAEWHRRSGITRVWGPMNFDIWHSYRLLTKGFDEDRFYGEPYNPRYYPDLWEGNGFTVKAEWDSVEISGRDTLTKMIERGAKRYDLLVERGYRFEAADLSNIEPELAKLRQVMSRSFGGFLGFTPLPQDQLRSLFTKAMYAIHKRMFLFVYSPDGRLAGFALALIELADAIRAMNGRTHALARGRFLVNRRRANKINFYLGGVTPEEIESRSGLGRAGFYCIINQMLQEGYDTLLLTLRLKGNAAHALPARWSPQPQREYALYERTL